MGLCSSVPRNANADMKLKLSFGSKSDKLVIPPSPIKGQPQNGNFNWSTPRSTTTFTHQDSKEETFFDSKPWLDSDCEDDFFSVNGDFTPSRGTTPVHHNFGTPSQNRIPGSAVAEPSPDKKKKLLELFRESIKDDQDDGHGHNQVKPTSIPDVMPKSALCTPHRTSIREKSAKSLHWCIPSLSSCRSFRERRSKTSPAIEVNGKH